MVRQVMFIYTVALCLTRLHFVVQGNSFHPITDCVCPQNVVTYECTVCGQAMAWEGTALDSCSGGEIALTNRDFHESRTITCNGGTVAARGISFENGCLSSQLNVTFDVHFQGRSVKCSADNGTHASQVGSGILVQSIEPYPPPEGLYLAEASPTGLLLSWNQTRNCPSLRHNIRSENCGQCPNTTDGTSVNCSDFTLSNSVTLCTFAVQAVICGINGMTLFGNFSDSITVNLTVPAINRVTTIPHYHIDNGLQNLTVLFSEVSPFDIYEDINGTVISYTVYYSDSNSGEICRSQEVNSSFCDNGVCSDEFDASFSSCRPSSDINVTVSVVTNLGEGPRTFPIMEAYRNNFVRVQVISESVSINCTFLSVPKGTVTSCNVTITYGDSCQKWILINGVRDSDNDPLIVISLSSFLEEAMSPEICGFRVSAAANARTVTVDGNLLAVLFMTRDNNPGISVGVIASVVIVILLLLIGSVILALSLTFILYYYKKHRKSIDITQSDIPMDAPNLKIFTVPEKCNMIDFAKKNIDNYDPDSGIGYYQFTEESKEYISPKTQVALVSDDEKTICTGGKAREIMGVSDKRECLKLPDLSGTQWKYVFIQSTSRIKILPEGSRFMFYGECKNEAEKLEASTAFTGSDDGNLKPVDKRYYTLKHVSHECTTLDFGKSIKGESYKHGLGYGFYEFTKPELISHDKQVILMDQDDNLYYGPGARSVIGIGPGQDYDETEEIKPEFDRQRWKHIFIRSRSFVRKLQPGTLFLYCDVASSEMMRVLEPFEEITVPDQLSEDERKIIKFAKKNIPYYNPKAGYAYYELIGCKYVIPERNIMALNKKGELYTGPGVRKLAGVDEGYDETKEVEAPDLTGTEWECIFIQVRRGYGRVLEPNTRFLYCEYDYTPEIN